MFLQSAPVTPHTAQVCLCHSWSPAFEWKENPTQPYSPGPGTGLKGDGISPGETVEKWISGLVPGLLLRSHAFLPHDTS